MRIGSRRMREFLRRGVTLASLCLAGVPLGAQPMRTLRVGSSTGTLDAEFTTITSVRELRDGRVLVTDGRERKLLVGDFRTGAVQQVGRNGSGPGEYGIVASVRPLAGDSTILADFATRRWLLLDGARIVGQHSPDHPAVLASRGFFTHSDTLGHVLTLQSPERASGVTVTDAADSSRIVLIDRRTGVAETVARVRNAERRIEIERASDGRVTRSSSMAAGPLRSEEQAVLFADGWLAVARLDPFRVDWRSPTGVWTRGRPLPAPVIRVNARERDAYFARNPNTFAPSAVPGLPATPRPTASDFPATVPPFALGAVSDGPAGLLLIKRHRSADVGPSHYLLVDRRGSLMGELVLPENASIVGAGPQSLYVVVKDDDDLQTLHRYRWP
jgi:hypothetical protein